MCYCNDAETEYKDERQGNQIMTGGGNGLNRRELLLIQGGVRMQPEGQARVWA